MVSHLVSMCVTSNDNWLGPTGHQARDVLTDNGLSEHSSSQYIPNSTIGWLPHLLQLKFYQNIMHIFLQGYLHKIPQCHMIALQAIMFHVKLYGKNMWNQIHQLVPWNLGTHTIIQDPDNERRIYRVMKVCLIPTLAGRKLVSCMETLPY